MNGNQQFARDRGEREVVPRGHLHLQARADPGDGVPVAAQAHAQAASRAHRPGAGRTLPRARLGVAQAETQGQHYYDAELHRLRAEILLDTDGSAVEEAEALFGHSLEIARRQEAKAFELRTATSLARLWQRQGKRAAARALIAPLCAWFIEGFDTSDQREAKALPEEPA